MHRECRARDVREKNAARVTHGKKHGKCDTWGKHGGRDTWKNVGSSENLSPSSPSA